MGGPQGRAMLQQNRMSVPQMWPQQQQQQGGPGNVAQHGPNQPNPNQMTVCIQNGFSLKFLLIFQCIIKFIFILAKQNMNAGNQQPQQQMMNDGPQQMGQQQPSQQVIPGGSQPRSQQVGSSVSQKKANLI